MDEKTSQLQMSYIKRSKAEDVKTVVDCLKLYASSKPEQEFAVFISGDFSREVVTWKELYDKSCTTARALVKLGVKKDEVVGINISNCPQWLYLTFGAMMAGARPVGLVCTYTDGSDLIAMMEKLQNCSVLAMSPGDNNADWNIVKSFVELKGEGEVSSSKMPYLRYLIAHEPEGNKSMVDVLHFDDLIKDVPDNIPLPTIQEDDIAFLFQTSGSTGVPKVVAQTHKSFMIMRPLMLPSENLGVFNDRSFLWLGGFPLNVLYGAKRITLAGFSTFPDDRLKFNAEVITKEECFLVFLLPHILDEFIRRQDELDLNWSVGMVSTGGQPIKKDIANCLGKLVPMLAIGYGGTEFFSGAAVVYSKPEQFQENLCGIVSNLPGMELKVVDANEEIVPVNTKGEIFVRSPMVFKGYYNDPEKTASVKTPDGWYKTDDVGWLNDQGMLYVEGRKSSMIVSGGMNVTPEILERALESHPAVCSVVVVPVPDEVYHQVVCACVILNPGNVATAEDLLVFLKEYTNDKQGLFTVLPKYFMFLDELPKTHTGKINRKAIAKMAETKFSS